MILESRKDFINSFLETAEKDAQRVRGKIINSYIPMTKSISTGIWIERISRDQLMNNEMYRFFPVEDTLVRCIQYILTRKGISFTSIRQIMVDSTYRVGDELEGFASYNGSYELNDVNVDGRWTSELTVYQLGYIMAGRGNAVYIDIFATSRDELAKLSEIAREIRIAEEIF